MCAASPSAKDTWRSLDWLIVWNSDPPPLSGPSGDGCKTPCEVMTNPRRHDGSPTASEELSEERIREASRLGDGEEGLSEARELVDFDEEPFVEFVLHDD